MSRIQRRPSLGCAFNSQGDRKLTLILPRELQRPRFWRFQAISWCWYLFRFAFTGRDPLRLESK